MGEKFIALALVAAYLLAGTAACGLLNRFAKPSHCGFWEGLSLWLLWPIWVVVLAIVALFAGIYRLATGKDQPNDHH